MTPNTKTIVAKTLENDMMRKKVTDIVNSKISAAKEKLNTRVNESIKNYNAEIGQLRDELLTTVGSKITAPSNTKRSYFQQKTFETQQSIITKMLHLKDISTIYHLFLAFLITTAIGEMTRNNLAGEVVFDFSFIAYQFSNASLGLTTWIILSAISLLIVPLVQKVNDGSLSRYVWIPLFICLQFSLFAINITAVLAYKFGCATTVAMVCEMIRIQMKTHSYIREKILFGMAPNEYTYFIPKDLNIGRKDLCIPTIDVKDVQTELGRYMYFFFAPTLIYRDEYPRLSNKIRWTNVLYLILNCIGSFVYTFVMFQTFCVPYFRESWKDPWSMNKFLMSMFRAMAPSTMIFFLSFFGVFHGWFNLFAELMNFGDRKFYEDWWNSASWGNYYRKWNSIGYDWLHTYVYQDLVRFTNGRIGRTFSYVFVFLYSAIAHEFIISMSFRFFYPVLLLCFLCPGMIFISITKTDRRLMNVFFWAMLLIGNGILMILYSWEYYARLRYDFSTEYGYMNFMVPHSWFVTGSDN